MDINWNLLGTLPDIGGNAVKAYDAGRQQAFQKSVAQKAASGDYTGAQTEAGNFGDLQAVEHFQQQGQAQQDRTRQAQVRKYETGAAAAFALAKAPVEARGALFQSLQGRLKADGWTDEDLSHVDLNNDQYLNGLAAQGMSLADQLKQSNEDRTFNMQAQNQAFTQAQPKVIVGPDGSAYQQAPVSVGAVPGFNGGGAGFAQPSAPVQVAGGQPQPTASNSGPVSRDQFAQAIALQESNNNYTARNASTGAMGKYQVMPATGRVLAQRLGLPWQPALMAQDTPQARQYQDAIGNAAIDEAYRFGNGDVNKAAMYYHGGSNQSIWGPKTQQYARDINAKLGIQGGQPQAQPAQTLPGGLTKILQGQGFDRWSPSTQNGLHGQVNEKTGEFKADPGQTSGQSSAKIQQANAALKAAVPALNSSVNDIEKYAAGTDARDWALIAAGRDITQPPWNAIASKAAQQLIGSKASFGALIKPLVRAAGEGTFTDQDANQMLELIPSPGDTADTAKTKISQLRSLITSKQNGVVQPAGSGQGDATKSINGKNYFQRNGKWYAE